MQTVGLPDGPASGLEAFQELERFLSDAAEAHLGLSELERGSERRSRELVRLSLQAHVDARGDGDVGEAIVVSGPDGPVRLAYKRLHTRSVLTLFGEVRITRVGYGAPGREAIHPLDAELGLPERIYSYECQRRLISGAICGPFDEAIALVAEMTGLTVPKRSAEQIVREAGVDFDAFYAERAQAQTSGSGIRLVALCRGFVCSRACKSMFGLVLLWGVERVDRGRRGCGPVAGDAGAVGVAVGGGRRGRGGVLWRSGVGVL